MGDAKLTLPTSSSTTTSLLLLLLLLLLVLFLFIGEGGGALAGLSFVTVVEKVVVIVVIVVGVLDGIGALWDQSHGRMRCEMREDEQQRRRTDSTETLRGSR
jgi:hypothetical protein